MLVLVAHETLVPEPRILDVIWWPDTLELEHGSCNASLRRLLISQEILGLRKSFLASNHDIKADMDSTSSGGVIADDFHGKNGAE